MIILSVSCNNENSIKSNGETALQFQVEGQEMVYTKVQDVEDYNKLSYKKDVVFTYTYQTPDNKTDISTEKYIF